MAVLFHLLVFLLKGVRKKIQVLELLRNDYLLFFELGVLIVECSHHWQHLLRVNSYNNSLAFLALLLIALIVGHESIHFIMTQ